LGTSAGGATVIRRPVRVAGSARQGLETAGPRARPGELAGAARARDAGPGEPMASARVVLAVRAAVPRAPAAVPRAPAAVPRARAAVPRARAAVPAVQLVVRATARLAAVARVAVPAVAAAAVRRAPVAGVAPAAVPARAVVPTRGPNGPVPAVVPAGYRGLLAGGRKVPARVPAALAAGIVAVLTEPVGARGGRAPREVLRRGAPRRTADGAAIASGRRGRRVRGAPPVGPWMMRTSAPAGVPARVGPERARGAGPGPGQAEEQRAPGRGVRGPLERRAGRGRTTAPARSGATSTGDRRFRRRSRLTSWIPRRARN
jgi:hypothetical protein